MHAVFFCIDLRSDRMASLWTNESVIAKLRDYADAHTGQELECLQIKATNSKYLWNPEVYRKISNAFHMEELG